MIKKCVICGKEFQGRNCSKCCSVECQEELRKKNKVEYKKRQELAKLMGKKERPKDVVQPKQKNTLCWSCQKACGGCRWSRALKPVRGWKAEKIKVKGDSVTGKILDSYIVKSCPKYIKDS